MCATPCGPGAQRELRQFYPGATHRAVGSLYESDTGLWSALGLETEEATLSLPRLAGTRGGSRFPGLETEQAGGRVPMIGYRGTPQPAATQTPEEWSRYLNLPPICRCDRLGTSSELTLTLHRSLEVRELVFALHNN